MNNVSAIKSARKKKERIREYARTRYDFCNKKDKLKVYYKKTKYRLQENA